MQFREVLIKSIQTISANTKHFRLEFSDKYSLKFEAGQFVVLNLPINSSFITRSYSIASAPSENGHFDLCISHKPGGVGTDYLFNQTKPGSIIQTSEPQGKFILDPKIDTDLFFIATGTGIAPFRSMIREIYINQIPHKRIFLIFGNRNFEDILYKDELEKLSISNPEFSFIPVLSGININKNYNGLRGRVHEVYTQFSKDLKGAVIYICGAGNMVKETRINLKNMGIDKNRIKYEMFN